MMALIHGAVTDVGRTRLTNEDHYFADSFLGLYVVCDGLGGHNAGEVASHLAPQAIQDHLLHTREDPSLPIIGGYDDTVSLNTNRLGAAIRFANEVILEQSFVRPECAGMGTTVVAAWVTGPVLSIAHLGDSRLYLIRRGTIQPLTTDHSWVHEQVRQGLMTEEEAERSPKRHVITRALGIAFDPEVELAELPLLQGDRLVLCSDGLTRGVTPHAILQAAAKEDHPQRLTEHLVALANEAGGEDNVTVIVVSILFERQPSLWERLKARWFSSSTRSTPS
jgi:protein phosphatase